MQSRFQSLHETSLLTEDAIVDCVEVLPTARASASEVEQVRKTL